MRERAAAGALSGALDNLDPYTRSLLRGPYVRILAVILLAGAAIVFAVSDGAGPTLAEDAADDAPRSTLAAVAGRGGPAPNVIVVMVDDQSMSTFKQKYMPKTFKLLQHGEGRELNGFAAPPLCCPSRAGFITGQYPHNHGVLRNSWRFLREPNNTLPAWLKAAGYRTGFVGKYLNHYNDYPDPAGGWDSWFELKGSPGYFDYDVSDQGVNKRYGARRSEYSTTVVTEESKEFIREEAGQGDPFFLWSSYFAPHSRRSSGPYCTQESPLPLRDDFRRFKDLPVEIPKNYNERNIDDKPSRIRRERLEPGYDRVVRDRVRCTIAAMQEVDRGVADLRQLLRRKELDDDTVIFYISDNGYFFGEHRIKEGKILPYREAVEIPFMAHVPKRYLDGRNVAPINQSVSNVDLAPTILDFAGARPCTRRGDCRVMDGRSMVPLMKGGNGGWPKPRPISIQLRHDCEGYNGVYSGREIYIEWLNKKRGDCAFTEQELYDLRKDPFQLKNRLYRPSDGAVRDGKRLRRLADRLGICAGIEGRDSPQQGRPFC